MKRTLLTLIAAVLLTGTVIPISHAAEKPMHPAIAQLDLDGDMVLFLNTETIEQGVLDYLDRMLELVLSQQGASSTGPQYQALTGGLNTIKAAIEWSGLLSLDSYAVSVAPVEDTLSRTISIASHTEADAGKPLWRLIACEPRQLQGISYVPADAVYTANSSVSLAEAWKIVNEAIEEFVPPEKAAELGRQIAMVEMMLGTNITAITGSLDQELLVSIQLSEEEECLLPLGAQPVAIPEPSLLIGLQTKSPLVHEILLRQLQQSGAPLTTAEQGGYTLHTLSVPVPAPFPVAPTVVQTDDYLLIGSSPEVIAAALDSKASGNGLASTPLYQKLFADAPAETSGIEFLSPRFMQTYLRFIREGFAGMDDDAGPVFDMMLGGFENMYSGAYSLKTSTGLYTRCYADYGGMMPVELFVNAYFGAIFSAVAIPLMSGNQEMAMATEAQAGCATISTALRIHWVDHQGFEGITGPFDLAALNAGDLDGNYFNDASYRFENLIDGQNYTIVAQGIGDAAGMRVAMTVVDGEVIWELP